jgi:hypothetical protein
MIFRGGHRYESCCSIDCGLCFAGRYLCVNITRMNRDNPAVQHHRLNLDTNNLLALKLSEHPLQYTGPGQAFHAGTDRAPVAGPLRQTALLAPLFGDVRL